MIHLAIRIDKACESREDLADFINYSYPSLMIRSFATHKEIKEYLRSRIERYPNEHWIITSSDTTTACMVKDKVVFV